MARREPRVEDDEAPPAAPAGRREERGKRSRLESVIPEMIKNAVRGGVDRAGAGAESIKDFISESKLPKEIAHAILQQIDDTKNGLFRVVAKEIRGFLEATDFQRELQKLLTTVSFEIKTEIRFIPNDSMPEKLGRPQVKADMKVKRQKSSKKPGDDGERDEATPTPPAPDEPPDDRSEPAEPASNDARAEPDEDDFP